MRSVLVLILVTALFAGCTGDDAAPVATPDTAPAISVLSGAVEPADFDAPTFSTLGAVAAGGPAYGAGEPSIWGAMDGGTPLLERPEHGNTEAP